MTTLVWVFAPDWADGITEKLEWLTDILTSPAGVEQCRALRRTPRRTWNASYIVDGPMRTQLTLMMSRNGAQPWLFPVWPDGQYVSIAAGRSVISCETAGRDFVAGGNALVMANNSAGYEILTVQSVADGALMLAAPTKSAWSSAQLYPCRMARLVDMPQLDRITDDLMTFNAEFIAVEDCDWPALTGGKTYQGYPVLTEQPEASENLTAQYQRLLLSLDNGIGNALITDTAQMSFITQSCRWLLAGVDERGALRSRLYQLRGRQSRVWVPTFNRDFELVANITAGNAITVRYVGFTEYRDLTHPGQRDIQIACYDGRLYHTRIYDSLVATATTEVLNVDTYLPALLISDVAAISFMTLSRLADDSIEITHHSDVDGVASSHAMFRGVNTAQGA